MTNEEKKEFIIGVHSLFMKLRPYDGCVSVTEIKEKEDALWNAYSEKFYSLIPKSLYKYRKADNRAISNFENDKAWFCCPMDFDDTVDSTINNDIDLDLMRFDNNQPEVLLTRWKTNP